MIGTYALRPDGVVDGDTLKVVGIQRSLRLLAIDTEEQPRPGMDKALRALMEADFAAYAARMSAGKPLPAKYPTPLGAAATRWAKGAIGAGDRLRLERDAPDQGADAYGRTLCHAWVVPAAGGPAWHYGVEVVRRGFSPYFVKYGRSRRYHRELVAAQDEARRAGRGIWDPEAPHYPDYPRRLAWWNRRADALEAYAAMADPPIRLGDKAAIRLLSGRVGEPVRVFGLVDEHDPKAIRGRTVRIGGRQPIELEILADGLAPERWLGEFLVVSGPLDRKGSVLRGRTRYMRIPVTDASQVRLAHE